MAKRKTSAGFTLIELLVVVAVIALLVSILLPSLSRARQQARAAQCLSSLHALGISMHYYCSDYRGFFWPGREDRPKGDGTFEPIYFWGRSVEIPGSSPKAYELDPRASGFMKYLQYDVTRLWCPDQPWEDLTVWQAAVRSTNYGYNAYYLDPATEGYPGERKSIDRIRKASDLFVFADSGITITLAKMRNFYNSTFLDPVDWPTKPNKNPTNQFRHLGRSNALCVDGHAQPYEPSPLRYDAVNQLGFVSDKNSPHYEE